MSAYVRPAQVMATCDAPIEASSLGGGKLLRWLVTDGASVREDQPIAEYSAAQIVVGARPRVHQLRAPVTGTLAVSSPPAAGAVLAVVRVCTHPMLFSGALCAVCGTDVTRLPRRTRALLEERHAGAGRTGVSAAGRAPSPLAAVAAAAAAASGDAHGPPATWWPPAAGDPRGPGGEPLPPAAVPLPGMTRFHVQHGFEIALTDAHAEAADVAFAARLRASRKLSLILDLDHTLIHATYDARTAGAAAPGDTARTAPAGAGDAVPATDAAAVTMSSVGGGGDSDFATIVDPLFTYRVKLRPHVREFLAAAADMYELGVDTAGTRAYAQAVRDGRHSGCPMSFESRRVIDPCLAHLEAVAVARHPRAVPPLAAARSSRSSTPRAA